MAFFLSNSNSFDRLRCSTHKIRQDSVVQSQRGFHVGLGEREKALLSDDPALTKFRSYKPSVRKIKKIGDALTIVVAAACCYEIYQHIVQKKTA
ncbi:hypothetical protein ZOSMA_2G03420 [Zostera marina]|uniref:Uncharacterized protein n=1 Tax=Zostera marina TaxID=29655 RepID=A0A0K9PDM6_ZOSMR|nr:hypothetical protein ZOSMA_2G03420 [Zostera marina]